MSILFILNNALLLPYFAVVIVLGLTVSVVSGIRWLSSRLSHFLSRKSESTDKQKIVFLGSGWGCYTALANLDSSIFDITIISPRDHFLFTPLLCASAVGTVETRSIVESINFWDNKHNCFLQGSAVDIDYLARKVCYQSPDSNEIKSVPYDRLIVGVGATSNTFGVEGVDNNVFFLKEANDAQKIRARILQNINLTCNSQFGEDRDIEKLLHVVIVGGGPTGVELSGELSDFVQSLHYRIGKNLLTAFKITIVERSRLLSGFPVSCQEYTSKLLITRRFVHVKKSSVTKILPGEAILSDGSSLKSDIIVWTAGIAQVDFIKRLKLHKNEKGQLYVDENLSVTDKHLKHQVYSLGDCAQIVGQNLSCTAQVAMQQGKYIAGLLNASGTKQWYQTAHSYPPFIYRSLGIMAYIGDFSAVVRLDVLPFRVHLYGIIGFLSWRLGYLLRQFSWRQRIQVFIDWVKTILFGRDLVCNL